MKGWGESGGGNGIVGMVGGRRPAVSEERQERGRSRRARKGPHEGCWRDLALEGGGECEERGNRERHCLKRRGRCARESIGGGV